MDTVSLYTPSSLDTPRRCVVIVLDSVGIGGAPDAESFNDRGADTLLHVAEKAFAFELPTLASLGLARLTKALGPAHQSREGALAPAALTELSPAKDTTIGHHELMGLIAQQPDPLFPDGFPPEVMKQFERLAGTHYYGNIPASGTDIIDTYGADHIKTGYPIVYTSGDSVFQIAAHEDIWPLPKLYELCQRMRDEVLVGPYAVGRVIARPFVGSPEQGFTRTSHRHDFGLRPSAPTVLNALYDAGITVTSVGKINDIFCGEGISQSFPTSSNADGMTQLSRLIDEQESGLIFANLVDFDMLWGHRRDVRGYARGLEDFDEWLETFISRLDHRDMLIITADHGCDPTYSGTDHTRERVPFLRYAPTCAHPVENDLWPTTFNAVGQQVSSWLLGS